MKPNPLKRRKSLTPPAKVKDPRVIDNVGENNKAQKLSRTRARILWIGRLGVGSTVGGVRRPFQRNVGSGYLEDITKHVHNNVANGKFAIKPK
jgi:hypothetical protein